MANDIAGQPTRKAGVSRWARKDPRFGPRSKKQMSRELAGVTIIDELGREIDMFDLARRYRRDLETRHELREDGTKGNWRSH